MKKKILVILSVSILLGIVCFIGFKIYTGKFGNKTRYDNSYFGIETYKSNIDKDNDGIDDQTDILNNVRDYIATKPQYESKYYAGAILMMVMGFALMLLLLDFVVLAMI